MKHQKDLIIKQQDPELYNILEKETNNRYGF